MKPLLSIREPARSRSIQTNTQGVIERLFAVIFGPLLSGGGGLPSKGTGVECVGR